MKKEIPQLKVPAAAQPLVWASEYWLDAAQRAVLYLDVMRQRGDQYREHLTKTAPHVLDYDAELVVDGRTLKPPVNYALVRIKPPANVTIDETRRPFVVVDPRAGHGPGIGGFKADSEIGVALKAGHPCYFVGFLPEPVPGQTIEHIAGAEAVFLETVIKQHPAADGKPCVIGNCQAGWAVMMLAAVRPELFGPIIIAGSPLSYWAGVRGKNPMRYTGGLLGGSWLTALTGDLGSGKFDGAWLVQNFESLNPANTLWTKQYNLYSKIDSEAERYLDFEKWWGGHVNLNAEEIQFIVDELFVGNNLTSGRVTLSDGTAVDLRNIRSPILVFCSKGDNVTPPEKALGWISDLYTSVDEIRSCGQTIVYSVHEKVGHLGIFVSGSVARKEHDEFSSNIDLIDTLPPGLYEATFTPKAKAGAETDLVSGDWIMRCEARTIDDILALKGNRDDRLFEAAAKVSKANLELYRRFAQPVIRSMATPATAQAVNDLHPLRLQYEMFSSANPLMAPIASLADDVKAQRKPVSPDNPFLRLQEVFSTQMTVGLDLWRDMRDAWAERLFLGVYGSPVVQAIAGLNGHSERETSKLGKNPLHAALLKDRISDLKSRVQSGGSHEALIRSALYIGMTRGRVDERSFEIIKRIRESHEGNALSLADFKKTVREQFFMLLLDQKAAVAAIPALLPADETVRQRALDIIRDVLSASDEITGETLIRFDEVSRMFNVAQSKDFDTRAEPISRFQPRAV
jgi:pimeloyl-ACP methyl ester carboxylesterase